jgi:hypothetical protein
VIAFVSGVCCLVLIRAKDFEGHHGQGQQQPAGRHREEPHQPAHVA